MRSRSERAAIERGLYQSRLAAGTCVRCGRDREGLAGRMCPACRSRYATEAKARREDHRCPRVDGLPRRHRGDHGDPNYEPTHWCHACYGLAHRRPPEGCWSCGEEYAPEDLSDLALRVMTSSHSGWCWGER